MLRSFVISTARFSMFWLCPDFITARFENNWLNVDGYEGTLKKSESEGSKAFTANQIQGSG